MAATNMKAKSLTDAALKKIGSRYVRPITHRERAYHHHPLIDQLTNHIHPEQAQGKKRTTQIRDRSFLLPRPPKKSDARKTSKTTRRARTALADAWATSPERTRIDVVTPPSIKKSPKERRLNQRKALNTGLITMNSETKKENVMESIEQDLQHLRNKMRKMFSNKLVSTKVTAQIVMAMVELHREARMLETAETDQQRHRALKEYRQHKIILEKVFENHQ